LHPQTTLNRRRPESGIREDGRGSGLMAGLCGGADIFRLIILLSAVVFPQAGAVPVAVRAAVFEGDAVFAGLGGRCTVVLARRPPSPDAYGPFEAVN
jgi:hypothetical protein